MLLRRVVYSVVEEGGVRCCWGGWCEVLLRRVV